MTRALPGFDEVHLWQVDLDCPAHERVALTAVLSPDELERAGRLVFALHAGRFTVARGALRCILAAYLRVPPASLRFDYGVQGKPALAGEPGLSFNLSHSGGLALVALAAGRALGVDVEGGEERASAAEIVRSHFSAAEQQEFDALPVAERPTAFRRGWTRKEAYLKARGAGLTAPLDSFDVALGPGRGPGSLLLATRPDPADAERWSIVDVDAGSACSAALAIAGPPPAALRAFRFDATMMP